MARQRKRNAGAFPTFCRKNSMFLVVPANAGSHNPGWGLQKVFTAIDPMTGTA
jgi:hypothetical protein